MPDNTSLIPTTIASAFTFGMVLALLGSIKIPLAKRLGLDEARVGGLLSALNLALIPLMLLSGFLVDQLGVRGTLVVGTLVTSLSVFCLALSRTYSACRYSFLLAGAGGACISTSAIVLMPLAFFENNPSASANLGNVFFGLGALITPALADLLIQAMGLRRTLTVISVLCLVPALTAMIAPGGAFHHESGGDLAVLLQDPILWLAGLVLMLYMPLEGSLGAWATTYLTELRHTPRQAAFLLSGFWLTFLASRLIAGILQEKGTLSKSFDPWLILTLALAAAVVLGNLSGTHGRGTAGFGLLVLGFLLGPIFPTLVGILFRHFPNRQGTAYGVMFAVGATGGLILPPFIGRYARRTSVKIALRIPSVVALGLGLAALGLGVMVAAR